MSTLARFVVRPAGNTNESPGDLLIGALFKTQNPDLLRPGVVYEIRDVLGVLAVVPVGDAAIGVSMQDSKVAVSWCSQVDHIVQHGGVHLLTKNEVRR